MPIGIRCGAYASRKPRPEATTIVWDASLPNTVLKSDGTAVLNTGDLVNK